MPGSSMSVAEPNIVLNTIAAEALSQFADRLEGAVDFTGTLNQIIKETIKRHRRILFNGNGYGEEWTREAEARGLSNIPATPDALPALICDKTVELYERHHVFSSEELHSRYDIMLENYCKTVNIEALTLIDIVNKHILPSVLDYENVIAETLNNKSAALIKYKGAETAILERTAKLADSLYYNLEKLTSETECVKALSSDHVALAEAYKSRVLPAMEAVRADIDALELIVSKKHWPFPSYDDLLHSVK